MITLTQTNNNTKTTHQAIIGISLTNQMIFINLIFSNLECLQNKHNKHNNTLLNDKTWHNQQKMQSKNHIKTQSYHANPMKNKILICYYLKQHEITKTKTQFTNFTQIPNTAESLQMTMNTYLMAESSKTSKKHSRYSQEQTMSIQ